MRFSKEVWNNYSIPKGWGKRCKEITASLYFCMHADYSWSKRKRKTKQYTSEMQSAYIYMTASEYIPVTSGNERQHLRRDGKKRRECIYPTVLLKSHLYSYWAKLPIGVNVLISGSFKPAENTSHPRDVQMFHLQKQAHGMTEQITSTL